jgi:plastocyanin
VRADSISSAKRCVCAGAASRAASPETSHDAPSPAATDPAPRAGVAAKTVDLEWKIASYDDLELAVGDSLKFEWSGSHDVWSTSGGCAFSKELASTAQSSYTKRFDAAGVYNFACSVGSHCAAGQQLKVTVVGAPTPAPAKTPAKKPAAKKPKKKPKKPKKKSG